MTNTHDSSPKTQTDTEGKGLPEDRSDLLREKNLKANEEGLEAGRVPCGPPGSGFTIPDTKSLPLTIHKTAHLPLTRPSIKGAVLGRKSR
ncbi:MAG: hypothetical protein L6R43_04495 [Planctomycetes bacterium]|nr:hypothetical protein [Planctomycetota bacterium]